MNKQDMAEHLRKLSRDHFEPLMVLKAIGEAKVDGPSSLRLLQESCHLLIRMELKMRAIEEGIHCIPRCGASERPQGSMRDF